MSELLYKTEIFLDKDTNLLIDTIICLCNSYSYVIKDYYSLGLAMIGAKMINSRNQ